MTAARCSRDPPRVQRSGNVASSTAGAKINNFGKPVSARQSQEFRNPERERDHAKERQRPHAIRDNRAAHKQSPRDKRCARVVPEN
ncbi:hypothetical protein MRX96_026891 [Rhipicephalus microplus]